MARLTQTNADSGIFSSIVALHGLNGHAWSSFTTSEPFNLDTGNTQDINWLRDFLPDLLGGNSSIHYRIMTFGYNADVWMSKSVADIHTYVKNFLKYLDVERVDVSLSYEGAKTQAYLS